MNRRHIAPAMRQMTHCLTPPPNYAAIAHDRYGGSDWASRVSNSSLVQPNNPESGGWMGWGAVSGVRSKARRRGMVRQRRAEQRLPQEGVQVAQKLCDSPRSGLTWKVFYHIIHLTVITLAQPLIQV
ncbi:MAG: hypothetical protein ABIT23_07125 [Nitrosospira sp.]